MRAIEIFYGIIKCVVILAIIMILGLLATVAIKMFVIEVYGEWFNNPGYTYLVILNAALTILYFSWPTIKGCGKNVPPLTALVTINRITGHLNVYGPGVQIMWPLIEKEEEEVPLTMMKEADWKMKLSSQDDDLQVEGVVTVRTTRGLVKKLLLVGSAKSREAKIIKQVSGKCQSLLEEKVGNGSKTKKSEKIIQDGLGTEIGEITEKLTAFCDTLGVELVNIVISSIDYSSASSTTRSAKKESSDIIEIASQIVNSSNGDISWKEAMNKALIMTKNSKGMVISTDGNARNVAVGAFPGMNGGEHH